jgi:hypothetical protein
MTEDKGRRSKAMTKENEEEDRIWMLRLMTSIRHNSGNGKSM